MEARDRNHPPALDVSSWRGATRRIWRSLHKVLPAVLGLSVVLVLVAACGTRVSQQSAPTSSTSPQHQVNQASSTSARATAPATPGWIHMDTATAGWGTAAWCAAVRNRR